MKTTIDFIDQFVKISKIDDEDSPLFGQYGFCPYPGRAPFVLTTIDAEGGIGIDTAEHGVNVLEFYDRFRHYVQNETSFVHMAVDFPAAKDIKQDFVGVFCWQLGLLSLIAIPYSAKTGETSEYIKEGQSKHLDEILRDVKRIIE